MSEIVPIVVPLITTEAPAIGPASSFTMPFTLPVCCWETVVFCSDEVVSANTPIGTTNSPDNRIQFTNFDFFLIA